MSGLNPATFLDRLTGTITGHGFKKVIGGIDIGSIRTSAGLIPTAATTPLRAALETNFEGLQVANGQTDLGSLQFVVPRDYDASLDYLRIRFLAVSAGTDVPTIDATMYQKRAGAALSSDLNPVISAAVNNAVTKAGWVEINCDGKGVQPGDTLHFDFTTSAHAAHSLNIYGAEIVYKSDLVYYESTER